MSSLTAIGHRGMALCNPLAVDRLDRTIELLGLAPAARVLDLGCGTGELLARVARRWGCAGVGVDRDPDLLARGRAALDGAGLAVELIDGDAAAYLAGAGGFDVVAAMGASHVWGGTGPCLAALAAAVAPGGQVVLADGFWARPPCADYLAAIDGTADEMTDLAGLAGEGAAAGLDVIDVSVTSADEWDRYEWAHFRNVVAHADERPDDAEARALVERRRAWRDAYLRWGRDTLGFALVLFRRPRAARS